MPVVPTPTITDVDRKHRKKLEQHFAERDFLNYAVSYDKLRRTLIRLGVDESEVTETISDCVLAWDDKQEKSVKEDLNDRISAILGENGISSVELTNPFGVPKIGLVYSSSNTSLNKGLLKTKLISRGVSTTIVEWAMEEATTKTEYTTLQIRSVKKEGDKE